MSERTLYDKIWDSHTVAVLETGHFQIFVGLHLIHEVTTPQGFAMLNESGSEVAFPDRTFATMDHILPTLTHIRPYEDGQAEEMMAALERNVSKHGIQFFNLASGRQGIVHVIGPELGLTQPGMTIACGDSHTSTHGALGALGFGIGTTEVGHVLQTQTLSLSRLKVHRINFRGSLAECVNAKDVILEIIRKLGIKGGLGHAYEYGGKVFESMPMEERMTVCNMSIEGGARIGYVNPDEVTFEYLKGKEFSPRGEEFEEAKRYWKSVASDLDAVYDKTTDFEASALEPMISWGINPGQTIAVSENLPLLKEFSDAERETSEKTFAHMDLKPGAPILGTPIDVAFLGSCSNSRISDLREAARAMEGKKVNSNVKMLVVPGSQKVKAQAEEEGLDKIFVAAGAEWRDAGCSMCLGMNPDKLVGAERSVSSSNRNFIGRQGSPTGRTHIASPVTVAASAIAGRIADPRE